MTRIFFKSFLNRKKLIVAELVSNRNVHYIDRKATKTNKLFYIIGELPKYLMFECTIQPCSKVKNPFNITKDKKIK